MKIGGLELETLAALSQEEIEAMSSEERMRILDDLDVAAVEQENLGQQLLTKAVKVEEEAAILEKVELTLRPYFEAAQRARLAELEGLIDAEMKDVEDATGLHADVHFALQQMAEEDGYVGQGVLGYQIEQGWLNAGAGGLPRLTNEGALAIEKFWEHVETHCECGDTDEECEFHRTWPNTATKRQR